MKAMKSLKEIKEEILTKDQLIERLVETLARAQSDLQFHLRTGEAHMSLKQSEKSTKWIQEVLDKAKGI